jgi:acylpyruvate hydrolase
MRLVAYSVRGRVALGALRRDGVVDLDRAYRAALHHGGELDELAVADRRVPPDLQDFLGGGVTAMSAARRALAYVEQRQLEGGQDALFHPIADVELLPPIRSPGKLICVGLSYRSYLEEIGESAPGYPILFNKVPTSLIGHEQSIVLPRIRRQVDYEGELAVVIRRRGKYISERGALDHITGYACANDVRAHDIEFRTSQWTRGKILDTFCPLGPALVTRDELPDPGELPLRTVLNGETVLDACTSDMVFPVPALVSYVSSLTTLEPGDIILTGTPGGIGCNRNPQRFLRPGDEISVQIDGIGTLANPVNSESRS